MGSTVVARRRLSLLVCVVILLASVGPLLAAPASSALRATRLERKVTLRPKRASLRAVVAELSQQTGVTFQAR